MILVPIVLIGCKQQTIGFGVLGQNFVERQIGKPERFAAS